MTPKSIHKLFSIVICLILSLALIFPAGFFGAEAAYADEPAQQTGDEFADVFYNQEEEAPAEAPEEPVLEDESGTSDSDFEEEQVQEEEPEDSYSLESTPEPKEPAAEDGSAASEETAADVPVLTSVMSVNKKTTITWKKFPGASKYKIYKKTGSGKWKVIATLSSGKTKYVDKKVKYKKTYRYRLEANKGGWKKSAEVKIVPKNYGAPKLLTTDVYTEKGKIYGGGTFKAIKGESYVVYRKTSKQKEKRSNYKQVAIVTATGGTGSFVDSTGLKKGTEYDYVVARCHMSSNNVGRAVGKIQKKGIRAYTDLTTVTGLTVTNSYTKLTWKQVNTKKYQSYAIMVKAGRNGTYRVMATTKKSSPAASSYQFNYRSKINKAEGEKMHAPYFKTSRDNPYDSFPYFIDPDYNALVYQVRTHVKGTGAYKDQHSYGNYVRDSGIFPKINPTVISAKKNGGQAAIQWSCVPNADAYRLYKSKDGNSWTQAASVKAQDKESLSKAIDVSDGSTYFMVRAEYKVDGKTSLSGNEKGFTIKDQEKYSNTNVLLIGDSLTYGSNYVPKFGFTQYIFSYPYRIRQLTGIKYYNCSIPGASFATETWSDSKYRLARDVDPGLRNGTKITSSYPIENTLDNNNTPSFADFDVIILAAGTNDYRYGALLGNGVNDTDPMNFYGAVNTFMNDIKTASANRVASEQSPIKVVFVDYFYSDSYSGFTAVENRFTTKNDKGLTLTDYQKALDNIRTHWTSKGLDCYKLATSSYIKASNAPYALSDNLHLTRNTYAAVGTGFTQELIKQGILTAN